MKAIQLGFNLERYVRIPPKITNVKNKLCT